MGPPDRHIGPVKQNQNVVPRSRSSALIQMKAKIEPGLAVAAFPAGGLRHFQKQSSVEEERKTRRSPVQVELKLGARNPKCVAIFGVGTGNAVTGVSRFASSNLARSATTSGSGRASDPNVSYLCGRHSCGAAKVHPVRMTPPSRDGGRCRWWCCVHYGWSPSVYRRVV